MALCLRRKFWALSLGLLLLAVSPVYAGKLKQFATSREYVMSANSMQITTTRRKPSYSVTGKPVYTDVTLCYEVSPFTKIEIDGKRSEPSQLLPGMVVSIMADRKQGISADAKGELLARTVVATTKATPLGGK